MWSNYDEDLNENTFFKTLLSNHNDLIEKASKENLIICIPRQGTVQSVGTSQDLVLDHILVPGSPSEQYAYTLSGKCLLVRDKKIVNSSSCYPPQSIQVHFEETFYINDLKYTLWCLDRPLFQDHVSDLPVKGVVLETSQHCLDYLNTEGFSEIFTNLEKICQEFLQSNPNFALETLQTQKELVGSLYSNCLKLALKNRKTKTGNSKKCLGSLKLAIETCMQNILGREILQAINTALCDKNASLNRIVRNVTDLQLKHLNLPYEFCDRINKAKLKLNQLNNFVTVLDKINCLRQTFMLLYSGNTNSCITADTLLQMLVFLLTKLDINNWYSNLLYLTEFEFSQLNVSSYVCFMLTSLEAALEFIQSDWECMLQTILRPGPAGNSNCLFKLVESNDLVGLKNSLLKSDGDGRPNCRESCHPLCGCQNCSSFIHWEHDSDKYKVPSGLTNDRGQNLLSFAAQVGNAEIAEFLLSLERARNSADVGSNDFAQKLTEAQQEIDFPDYSGKTPLHYACLRGRQDVVLILVNCQADVNAKDQNLNTPLHLAVNNGHERCVKALLYAGKNLEINSANKDGNTALHLAVKWGYQEIARWLLENGASVSISNRKQQLVQDLAHDYHTSALIKRHMSSLNIDRAVTESSSVSKKLTDVSPPKMSPAAEQYKKLGILLKAIKNNDLPLVCFYLGFSDSNSITPSSSHFEKCHPLCLCEKCEDFDHVNLENRKSPEKINVNDCDPTTGYTPLHFAAKYGRTEILRILLDSEAAPNSRSFQNSYTPLHLACIYQNVKIVKELVKCGDCQIDPKDSEGNTPLYYACMKNDKRIVELLLVNGADWTLKNNAGLTIVAQVKEKQFFGIAALLDAWKKKPAEQDDDLF